MDYIEEDKKRKENNPSDDLNTTRANLRIIDTDLDPPPSPPVEKKEKTVRKNKLVNKLNLINFNEETVRLNFKHQRDGRIISFDVWPQLCFGQFLACLWQHPPDIQQIKELYVFQNILVDEGQTVLSIDASIRSLNKKGICFRLPDKSTQRSSRKARRFTCDSLGVNIMQNSITFAGFLMDFSSSSFRVEIHQSPKEAHQWLNPKDNVTLIILKGAETLYSCQCAIIKQDAAARKKTLILKPLTSNIQRFCPKEYRSRRLKLTPTPHIIFNHPFTGKLVTLKTIDVSGSGVSVEDDEENSVLLPGMIIPELSINLANAFKLKCKAQVIYRNINPDGNDKDASPVVQCGITFLDMDCNDHMRLLSLLHQNENQNIYICNEVDLDELWKFFFETGFIYPKKYKAIQKNKEKIRSTYEYLYTTNSNISRYFTWQRKGVIQGHLSMLRFYENTWLIHHLAALPSNQRKVGIDILKQIGEFTYDSYRLFSSHMDYLICYFRPENKFPNYFFGGIQKNIGNPKACSIDTFAYLHYRKQREAARGLPEDWELIKSTHNDLNELYNFYEHAAGGLMLQAMDLLPDEDMSNRHSLANAYQKINMKRQRRLYSLKKDNIIKAVFMANFSDFAINLSDLTNSISIFVLEPDKLTPSILYLAISQLSEKYEQKTFPVLVFPFSYTKEQPLKYERLYNLWALSMAYSDDYFKNFDLLI
ncbi:MAG: PilZ domain-containing protein [Desulfobacterales bacterium]|nr:PilZ domain-containing protein [Desulfobacterales bacterium]